MSRCLLFAHRRNTKPVCECIAWVYSLLVIEKVGRSDIYKPLSRPLAHVTGR